MIKIIVLAIIAIAFIGNIFYWWLESRKFHQWMLKDRIADILWWKAYLHKIVDEDEQNDTNNLEQTKYIVEAITGFSSGTILHTSKMSLIEAVETNFWHNLKKR
jgi:hypothetical protein